MNVRPNLNPKGLISSRSPHHTVKHSIDAITIHHHHCVVFSYSSRDLKFAIKGAESINIY